MFPVTVYRYDISMGMAAQMSQMLLGRQLDGIWHTGVVVHGSEYFFSGGIVSTPPGQAVPGMQFVTIPMGNTNKPKAEFEAFLQSISHKYTTATYRLLSNNCNHFTDEACRFLVGNGLPHYIINLPQEVLSSPQGAAFGQMIEQMERRVSLDPVQRDRMRMFRGNQVTNPGTNSSAASASPTTQSRSSQHPSTQYTGPNGLSTHSAYPTGQLDGMNGGAPTVSDAAVVASDGNTETFDSSVDAGFCETVSTELDTTVMASDIKSASQSLITEVNKRLAAKPDLEGSCLPKLVRLVLSGFRSLPKQELQNLTDHLCKWATEAIVKDKVIPEVEECARACARALAHPVMSASTDLFRLSIAGLTRKSGTQHDACCRVIQNTFSSRRQIVASEGLIHACDTTFQYLLQHPESAAATLACRNICASTWPPLWKGKLVSRINVPSFTSALQAAGPASDRPSAEPILKFLS